MQLDDAQIMERVQAGEVDLFDQLVSRYRQPLLHVAQSKLGDPVWAEDVVQEAFLAAFAARHTYQPVFAFRTWIWTITLNLCKRQYQKRLRRPREISYHSWGAAVHHTFDEPGPQDCGLAAALKTERREKLEALLRELPEAQADALRLRFFGGLMFQEIAQAMKCGLGTAKIRVKSGLLKLAERLRDEEAEPS